MKIVVDTNIVFSGLLNSGSCIGRLLVIHDSPFQFYSSRPLLHELLMHRKRLLTLTGTTDAVFSELQELVLGRITFIDEELIPFPILKAAIGLLRDVDPDDAAFLALTMHLNAIFWTGDKKLINGL